MNNFIGTAADGTSPLPNGSGILVGSPQPTIGSSPGTGNTIAYNGGNGVLVSSVVPSTGTSIRYNSIHSHNDLGIDLAIDGVTSNDADDADVNNANNLQNYPVLTAAIWAAGSVAIAGTLNSTPNGTFHIDFYYNTACDPSGFGEGLDWIGEILVIRQLHDRPRHRDGTRRLHDHCWPADLGGRRQRTEIVRRPDHR